MEKADRARKSFYERAVGIFTLILLLFCLFLFVFILINGKMQLLKNKYIAYYEFGSGLKEGTIVTLNGINVGQVGSVEIDKKNRVEVVLCIPKKYAHKIRENSIAQVVRPLMVGSKQINISLGSNEFHELSSGSVILSQDSSELIDLFSGVRIERILKRLDLSKRFFDITNNSAISANDIYEQAVTAIFTMGEFAKVMGEMSESINNMSSIMGEMSGSFSSMHVLAQKMDNMSRSMENMTALATSMEGMVSTMDKMGNNLSGLSNGMSGMSSGMKGINSGFTGLTASMTSLSKMADELVPMLSECEKMTADLEIILKAFQYNWFLKKEVEQVRREMDSKKTEK